VYSIILHNSYNIEYDVGYEVERIRPKGGSSILTRPRFLGRTENNSRVSSVSRKIITTTIPKIQNKAAMKNITLPRSCQYQNQKKDNHLSQGIKTSVLHNTPFYMLSDQHVSARKQPSYTILKELQISNSSHHTDVHTWQSKINIIIIIIIIIWIRQAQNGIWRTIQ
jgi:hypothetical protein